MSGGAEVKLEGLSWRPVRRRTPVFTDLDLLIPAGQRVLLAGPSGAGKSSLLLAIAGLLLTAGAGDLGGDVRIGGERGHPCGRAGRVGLLLQDPLAGVAAETVGRDVAFGLENQQVPREEIWTRAASALRDCDFPYPTDHPTSALSGGETQRLALAGSLAMDSDVVLLDEPTSMLDPAGAKSIREAVRRDATTRGSTTVIVEHHLEPWLGFADRLIVLGRDGSVVADGDPHRVLETHGLDLAEQGVWVPGLRTPRLPDLADVLVEPCTPVDGELVRVERARVELRHRSHRRGSRSGTGSTVALDDVSTALASGRALSVTGPNGSGKSTLVSLLAGLASPSAGQVVASDGLRGRSGRRPWRWSSRELARRLSWVPQLPEHGVVATTVADEVMASSRACGRDPSWAKQRADGLLESLGLSHLRDASPYHLSAGEQRRLMVAAALVHGPNGVLLDEPTVGQDRLTWAAVVGAVASARSAGCGVAVASHDSLAVDALGDDRLDLEHGMVRS
jgi:energy-coupling factor transporter ATP-binding protein EcfA2